jgi:hypothetical protein
LVDVAESEDSITGDECEVTLQMKDGAAVFSKDALVLSISMLMVVAFVRLVESFQGFGLRSFVYAGHFLFGPCGCRILRFGRGRIYSKQKTT